MQRTIARVVAAMIISVSVAGCASTNSKNSTNAQRDHLVTLEDREHQQTEQDRMIAGKRPVKFPAEPTPPGYRASGAAAPGDMGTGAGPKTAK